MSRVGRRSVGHSLKRRLSRLKNVSGVVWMMLAGAVATIGLATWGIVALVAWALSEPIVIAGEQGKPPTLNMQALEKLSGDQRKVALEQYGQTLAASRPRNQERMGMERRRPPENDPMRQQMEKLSEEDRRTVMHAAMSGRFEEMRQRMHEEIKTYFSLSKEEQVAFLDKKIDEMKARREEMEKRRADAEKNSAATGDKKEGDKPQDGNRRPRTRPTEDQHLNHKRERLSETDPQERAEMQAYFQALRDRAAERGEPMRGPGGGPR